MNQGKTNRNRLFSPVLIVSAGLTLVGCLLIWLHWLPLGIPGEWVWEYKPRESLNLLVYAGLGLLLLLLGAHLLWKNGLKDTRGARVATLLGLVALSLLVRYSTWKATPFIGLKMTQVTLSDVATTYYSQSLDIRNTGEFLRQYPRLMDALPYHSRTHPPGPAVFMHWVYSAVRHLAQDPDKSVATMVLLEFPPSAVADLVNQGPGRDYSPLETLGAFWVGLLTALLGALAVVPLYLAGVNLFGRRTGLVAGALGVVIPSGLLFPVSIDQLLFLDAALSLWLLVMGIKKERLWPLLASGLFLGVAMLKSFGILILVPGLLILVLWSGWGKGRARDLLAKGGGFLAAVALPAALLWAVYGCDMVVIYQKAVEAHRLELTQIVQRSYGKWVFGDLGDFFLLGGLPIFVYFLAFLAKKGVKREGFQIGNRLAWVFVAILLLLDFSGVVRGEAGRIWLFLMIIPTILAANALCENERGWSWAASVVLGLQYLQVISLQTNAVFLKPF